MTSSDPTGQQHLHQESHGGPSLKISPAGSDKTYSDKSEQTDAHAAQTHKYVARIQSRWVGGLEESGGGRWSWWAGQRRGRVPICHS